MCSDRMDSVQLLVVHNFGVFLCVFDRHIPGLTLLLFSKNTATCCFFHKVVGGGTTFSKQQMKVAFIVIGKKG